MLRKEILKQVAKEFNLSPTKIETLYNFWWKEVKELIESNDLKNIEDCEYTDVNIPNIGKLVINLHKAKYINERIKNKGD